MALCLISFDGKYYEYRGDGDKNDKGLAIGGYKSAFLANLVASYLLEKSKRFFNDTKFHGIYRDDGFVVFNGKKNLVDSNLWLTKFQKEINEITGGEFLQFTMDIWKPGDGEEIRI